MAVPGRKKASKHFSSTHFNGWEEDINVFCVPCDKDGSRLAAFGYCTVCHEHMCESCFKHHKRSFLSRCHTLLDKGSMPQTQQLLSTSAHTGQSTVVASKSGDPSQQGEICVKTSQDEKVCWVTGMVLLSPDQLVLIDWKNSSIKMVDTSSRSIAARLQLSSVPWDITSVTSDELVVTLPNDKTIQFISASSNKLTMKHTLKVDGSCTSISCYKGKLVVLYRYPAKLEILDRTGRVQTTVPNNTDGEQIFNVSDYVIANSRSIYVSNWGKGAVIQLNWQGRVIGTYGYLPSPRGLALFDDGCIIVCDVSRGIIQEISGDCTKGKVLLEGLDNPSALCWSHE